MLLGKMSAFVMLASSGDASPLDFNVDLALWTLAIFVGLFLVLAKFAWKPIIEGLNLREQTIADNIESAERSSDQAKAQLQAYEDKMASVHDEAAAIMAEAKSDAVAAKDKIMAEANAEAQRTRDRALAEIDAAKNAAVRELAESSADSAVQLAGSIVGRTLKKEDHSSLIQEAVKRFSGS